MSGYIINILPFLIAGIIAFITALHLENRGKVKNRIASVLGLFFVWASLGRIISEFIQGTITPIGFLIYLVIVLIGAVVYRLGVRRNRENRTSKRAAD